MAQITYRANLSAAIYPMSLHRAAGSVIIPGPDQNYDRRVDPTGEQKTPGIPQAIYMENVLPSVEGYQSVGYRMGPALPGVATDYVVIEVKRPDGNWPIIMAFEIGAQTAYFYKDLVDGWVAIPVVGAVDNFPTDPALYFSTVIQGNIVLWINGSSFIYTYGGGDVITYNNGDYGPAGVLDDVVCTLSSFNYHILVKNTAQGVSVLWSSLLDPFDFTPSLATGSGGGSLLTSQGNVVSAAPCPEGFYIFTKNNIILAVYTGNSRYPFKFVPVKDSQGIGSPLDVYTDIDESTAMVFTRHGQLHLVQGDRSAPTAPEVSEFLERSNTYDSYNKVTNGFSVGRRPVGYRTARPYFFGARYVCVSIKEQADETDAVFNAVLVYDTVLQRYGKLKFNHTKLFTYLEFEGNLITGINSEKLVLGAIDADTAQVRRLTFSRDPEKADLNPGLNHDSILVLGRFQYVRSRDICLDEIVLEGGDSKVDPYITLIILPSPNGKTFGTPSIPNKVPASSDAETFKYYSTVEAKNISLVIRGSFELNNVELTFHPGGSS